MRKAEFRMNPETRIGGKEVSELVAKRQSMGGLLGRSVL
jgi:hypothetical protein